MEYKFEESEKLVVFFKETSVSVAEVNPILEVKETALVSQSDKMFKIFSRPQIDLDDVLKFDKVQAYLNKNPLDQEILEQAEIQVKYSGYIENKVDVDRSKTKAFVNSTDYDFASFSYQRRFSFGHFSTSNLYGKIICFTWNDKSKPL
jgi:tRNA U34 5-carboxymethylaminomethyl modifying enzyme MnmG/GidA